MGSSPPYLFLERWDWTIIFFGSFVCLAIFSGWANGRDRVRPQGDDRDRGSRALIFLLSPVGMVLAFAGPYAFPQARIGFDPARVFTTAMVLFWIGLPLYIWAVLTLGKYFRTTVQILDEHRLVVSGPYRFLRHPVYTGGILIFAGLGLALGNWFSFCASALSTFIAYVWRIRVEESALHERFGSEFEEHRRRTWAVLPFVW